MKKIIIFTDGACSGNPGPGGWAAVLNHEKDSTNIAGYELDTTNNRMELMAAINAVKEAVKLGYDDVTVNSDSAYVVSAIKKCWFIKWQLNNWRIDSGDPVKNKDLWQEFYKLYFSVKKKGVKLTFNRVKGHAGNYFNELVDKLAKEQAAIAKGLIDKNS